MPKPKSPTWVPFRGGRKAKTVTPKSGETRSAIHLQQLKDGSKQKGK